MLDPKRLLTFRAVARERSFSRAARELALTQPAVSQQIRALEVQLGERLIDRRPGGFSLTAAGELLLRHADALAEGLRLAETQLGETLTETQRKLRIGAFPSVLATLVPTAIAKLHDAVDGFKASVIQGSTDELVGAVRDGRHHTALCFQDANQPRPAHAGARRDDLIQHPTRAVVGPRP